MKYLFLSITACTLLLSGCSSLFIIGEEESVCPGLPKGVLCKGPREITQMTDSQESLTQYIADEEDKARAAEKAEGDWYDALLPWTWLEDDEVAIVVDNRPVLMEHAKGEVVYVNSKGEARSTNKLPTSAAEAIRYSKHIGGAQAMGIAPNTRAVLEPAKVMRVYISPYEDAKGNLHMPGYMFVEVQKRRWSVGEKANVQPARITPLQIRTRSLEESQSNTSPTTNGLGVLKAKG